MDDWTQGRRLNHTLMCVQHYVPVSNRSSSDLILKNWSCQSLFKGFDPTSGSIKKSTKGIPHSNQYSMETWLSVLLDSSFPQQSVTINSLRLNQKKEMSRMKMQRSSLSDIFLKMRVQDDKISCSPLMENNKFL